jgi:hypothetical protein
MRNPPAGLLGLFAAALLAALAGLSPVLAQGSATAVITGSVVDGTGKAINGAKVSASGPAGQSATTDAAGTFAMTVPPGIYSIAIERSGYATVTLPDLVAVA